MGEWLVADTTALWCDNSTSYLLLYYQYLVGTTAAFERIFGLHRNGIYAFFFFTLLLSSFLTSRGRRCRPFPPVLTQP